MKKTAYLLSILLIVTAMLAGCAGGGKKIQPKPEPGWVALPAAVSESFSYRIMDKQAREMILGIKTDGLGPANRLEIKLLQQLAALEQPDEIDKAFDRIWDTDGSLRNIIQQDDSPAAFFPVLALCYFMLTYDDTYNWRDQTAEKLYEQTLQNMKPDQLSGYPLHFYALALLKNGKFDAARPFLVQLKKITTPAVYLKNLEAALDYAVEKENAVFAAKIIQHMLLHCQQNDLKLPEGKITAAMETFQKSGQIELMAAILLSDNSDNIDLKSYVFFDYIVSYQKSESVPTEKPVVQKKPAPKPVAKQSTVSAKTKAPPETERLQLRPDMARIRVQIIAADNKADYIDPDLGDVGRQLNASLRMSQVYLKDENIFLLASRKQKKLKIDQTHDLIVLMIRVSGKNARIDVTVLKGGEQIYNTVIDSVEKGETIIGGPTIDDTQLILRITTWLEI